MITTNRRTILAGTAAGALLGLGSTSQAAPGAPAAYEDLAPRQRLRFDVGWRFALGHAADLDRDFGFGRYQWTFAKQGKDIADPVKADFDDSTWRAVTVPHDWAIDLPFAANPHPTVITNPEDGDPEAAHGYKAIGRLYPENSVGWYRKVFTLEPADAARRLTLEFDGVFRDAVIILNGYVLDRHASGYTSFSVDIGNFVNTDAPNILVVRVDASLGEGWFYEGAGIYRHVWLVKTDPVHIPQWGVCVRGETSGHVAVETQVRNAARKPASLSLVSRIHDGSGAVVAEIQTPVELAAHETKTLDQSLAIAAPHLWSLDDPYLYTVRSELRGQGAAIDATTTRFGLRDIRFDAHTGFWLNGKPLKLHGVNNHQDHAGVGVAIPDSLHDWRVATTKAMGANIWRSSPNPPAPELLDACDRLGMLMIDETRMMTTAPEGMTQLDSVIRRDRNHPCIVLWSIGNEETSQQGTERGLKIALDMRDLIRSLDTTRPITAAMNHFQGYGITPALDVMGFNYYEKNIEPFRKLYPDMPIIGTETASAVSTRGEYVRDEKKGYLRAYDLDKPSYAATAEEWWSLYAEKPYLSGGLVWVGFDYRGEPTPYSRFPEISSHFGIFDTCGFPKDIYYYYRSWWQDEPVLHLLPHWNWEGQEGKPISVWAYSNLDAVELFVNGRSQGRQTMPRNGHVEWSVPYAPGVVTAYGYKGGKVIMKDERRTAGLPARLQLTCDRTRIAGDGRDTAILQVAVLDKAGLIAPKADNLVTFDIGGPAQVIGVGNGNPTSLEADRAVSRMAFNGLMLGILQSQADAHGKVTVTARADGLQPASVTLQLI